MRPDVGRSDAYNGATMILGFLYHDAAGGNDLLKIKGDWNNSYSQKDIIWKANSDKYIKDMMDN